MNKCFLYLLIPITCSLHAMDTPQEFLPSLVTLQQKLTQLADLLGGIPEEIVPPELEKKPIKKPTSPIEEPGTIEVSIPEVKIRTIMALDTGYLQPLERMPHATELEKATQKAQAKGTLNGILEFVNSDKFKPSHKIQIKDAVIRILTIDPLLISTAAIILRQAGIAMSENYDMMADYYHKRITFIADELGKIVRRKGKAHKGLREDVDEALSYPIELESEIQEAKTIIELQPRTEEARQAQIFIDRINELREWLLALLKKQENRKILEEVDLPVDFYISIFEQRENQVYCVTQVGPGFPGNVYKSFLADLKEIIVDIEEYKRGASKYSRSLKTYKIQSMINKLRGFLAHATESSYCQICLEDDIRTIARLKREEEFDIDSTFKNIREFFTTLYITDKNQAIKPILDDVLPRLKEAISQKECPIQD